MPLSELESLIAAARRKEEQAAKADIEKRLFPLWLANDAVSRLKGADSPISYQEFLNKTIGAERTERRQYAPEPTHKKTGQEIIDEFMPIIEADRGR